MRKTCLDMVYELARKDPRIFFIGSDLGVGTLKQFKAEMPGRFLMEGVSEANVVGMAAGLALEGKIVYVNTIATFLTRRCFDQVVLDLCLHNANVRLIANGGGVVYAPLGPTHEAIEDIAIFRALPRMTILAPADAEEMRRLMPATVDHQGPIYIRLGKGGDPVVTNDRVPFRIGKAYPMKEGSDALIVSTGVMLKAALDAAGSLEAAGIIRRYVALVDGKTVGAGFVAFIEVRLEKQSEVYSKRFEAAMLGRQEVIDCSFVTGDFDYLLKVAVADLDEFHRFLTQVLTRIVGVANTRTIIPVKRIKETTAVKIV